MANLKHFNPDTGLWEEIKVSTKFKDLYNTTVLTQDQNYANIGITNFNPNEDVLFSIWNSTWLQKDIDYTLNGGLLRIESKDGSNWSNGDTFNFIVLKNVDKDALPSADGSLIQDGSITIAKLAVTIQNYINKIGVSALTTTAVTLSDAINDLNTQLSENTQDIVDLGTNKIDKISIVNTLLATELGYVLDARQGKILNDLITNINNTLTSSVMKNKSATVTNFNAIVTTGIYEYTDISTATNKPAIGNYGILEVAKGSSYVTQKASSVLTESIQTRASSDGGTTWTAWKTITLT